LGTNRENTFDSGRNDDHPNVPYERLDVSLKDIAVAQRAEKKKGESANFLRVNRLQYAALMVGLRISVRR